jgi:hypothetical protein
MHRWVVWRSLGYSFGYVVAFRERRHRHLARRLVAVRRPRGGTLADVMAITKCRIWTLPVNRFTAPPRALRQGGRTRDGWSALT